MTVRLSYFLIAVIKYSDRNDLKKTGSFLAHNSKVLSTMATAGRGKQGSKSLKQLVMI